MTTLADTAAATAVATATCVFAVCGGGPEPPALDGVHGHVADSPVRTLRVGSLHAVVQSVPAADFSEDALRRTLSDAAELERCARAHHAVVCAAARCAPTVPLPLATLYFGDDRAREALGERAAEFRAALDRVAGRVEWGVKVWAAPGSSPHTASAASAATSAGAAPAAGSGRAYLERVRGRQQQREARQEAALSAADHVDATVRHVAVAARRLRLQGDGAGAAAHAAGTPRRSQLLNAAYLVSEDRAGALTEVVGRLREEPALRHVRIEVTGPWVPYSFLEGAGADGVRDR